MNTNVVHEKLLEQDHPKRHHKVRFTFESKDDHTTVHLLQTNVGEDEFKYMAASWVDYYFYPIKILLEE